MSKASPADVFVITPCLKNTKWSEQSENEPNRNYAREARQTFSVMIPDIRFAGVTSKAGFHTDIPEAATCSPSPPRVFNNSLGDLSSMTICCPEESDRSMEVKGAAT
jgi:hypothetical protein